MPASPTLADYQNAKSLSGYMRLQKTAYRNSDSYKSKQDAKHPEQGWRQSLQNNGMPTYEQLQGMIPGYSQLAAQGPQWADILARGYQGQGAPDMTQLSGMGVNDQTLGPGFSLSDARAWGIDPAEMLQHFGANAQIGQGNQFYQQMTGSPTFALNQAAAGQAQNDLMRQFAKQNMGGSTGANQAAMAAARSAGSRLRMQNRGQTYDAAMGRGSDTVGAMLAPWAQSHIAGQQGLMDQYVARMKALAEGRMNTQNLAGQVGMHTQGLLADTANQGRSLWADALSNAQNLGAQGAWHTADMANQNAQHGFDAWNNYFSQLSTQKSQKKPWWQSALGAGAGAAQGVASMGGLGGSKSQPTGYGSGYAGSGFWGSKG